MKNLEKQLERPSIIYLLKISLKTQNYLLAFQYVKKLLKKNPILNQTEKILLSITFRKLTEPKRKAIRSLVIKGSKSQIKTLKQISFYKKKIQKELFEICSSILTLLQTNIIPYINKEDIKSNVFYLKMKGDYYRYKGEVSENKNKEKWIDLSFKAYSSAVEQSEKLSITDPVKLSVSLNFSVFYYEVKNDAKMACQIAKQSFDDAISGIEGIEEGDYQSSTEIMMLLRDNLTLWTSEFENNEV